MAPPNGPDSTRGRQGPVPIPPMSLEEEDSIVYARMVMNDDRTLKRIIKKYHTYASLASNLDSGSDGVTSSSVEDARESFLLDLRSYQLSFKKATVTCETEGRQVEQYQREKERIDREHATLREQIEELKVALENAQMLKRRKIEYDLVTEKVNSLPPRDELEHSIYALENDMANIRAEQELQSRVMLNQKSTLDDIIVDLSALRFIGKEKETQTASNSARATPFADTVDTLAVESASEIVGRSASSPPSQMDKESNEKDSEKEEGEEDRDGDDELSGKTEESGDKEDDIEMGEVEEEPRDKLKKKFREEELEEGEASDFSSELSDPPDDD